MAKRIAQLFSTLSASVGAVALLLLCLTVTAWSQPLELAKQAFDAGHYEKAVQLFEQSQQRSPQCEVYFYIGVARYRLGQLDSAIVSFQTAATCDPNLFEAHVALGEGYAQKGNDAQALLSFEEALRLRPGDPSLMRSAGDLYLRHQLNDKALPLFQRLVALNNADPALRADLGALYGAVGDLTSAEEQFHKALQLQSDHPSALTGLANLRLKQGQPEAAVELLERAVKLVPNAHEPHFLLGSAYNGTERFEDAVRELTTAIRLGGSDPEIYYHLVRAYGRLGLFVERDKALAKFSELKKQSVDEADRRRDAAKLLAEAKDVVLAGDLVAATDLAERSYALNPDDPETVFRLAGLQFDQRLYDRALQNARQAVDMAPSDWRPHFLLGLIERAAGNLAAAQASFETAARLNPGAAEIHNEMGHTAMAGGDREAALARYERAVELAPENRTYAQDLAAAQALKDSSR